VKQLSTEVEDFDQGVDELLRVVLKAHLTRDSVVPLSVIGRGCDDAVHLDAMLNKQLEPFTDVHFQHYHLRVGIKGRGAGPLED
jgi:hypothetical protein